MSKKQIITKIKGGLKPKTQHRKEKMQGKLPR